jgi:Tat protein secretion system quality control protein TatD with DNase activity
MMAKALAYQVDMGFLSVAGREPVHVSAGARRLKDVSDTVVPLDRLLVETDSPSSRGSASWETQRAAHVERVAEVIADLRGTTDGRLPIATHQNQVRLFNP